jgi:hypothetical protein
MHGAGDSQRHANKDSEPASQTPNRHETTKLRKHERETGQIFRGFVVSWFRVAVDL